jgi:hypothetical protein
MRIVICLLFILFTLNDASSQTNEELYTRVPGWGNINLVSDPIPDTLSNILIVTNRPFLPNDAEGEYFPNAIAEYRKVTYLEVAHTGESWLIRSLDSFKEGMKCIDDGNDILLFVIGHGKTFPSSLTRALQIKERYDVSLILFDWPAKHSNFNKSLARIRRCGYNFYNLLLNLKEYRISAMSQDQHLSILAHSLGNYYLTHFAVNGSWQYLNEPFIDNIIFNAAAVRTKEHGEVISLLTISDNKYVVLNKFDKVLRGAHLLTSGKMLGNLVIEPHASNAEYIHFTDIAGYEHTYFAGYHRFEDEHEAVYNFYNTIIHGRKPDFSSPGFKPVKEKEYMIQ